MHLYTDGTCLVTHGGVEMGQGLHTKLAQVAAQALGLPLSHVFIAETSTDKVPNAVPTAGSMSTDLFGMAVLDACTQLARRLAPYREKMPAASPAELATAAWLDRVDLSAHGWHKVPHVEGYGSTRPYLYFTYGACASEVELDTLTGDFHILRTDIVMDVGKPLNPAVDIGQIEGGFVQGMGWLCLEELVWGDKQHPWVRAGASSHQRPWHLQDPERQWHSSRPQRDVVARRPQPSRSAQLQGDRRATLSPRQLGVLCPQGRRLHRPQRCWGDGLVPAARPRHP